MSPLAPGVVHRRGRRCRSHPPWCQTPRASKVLAAGRCGGQGTGCHRAASPETWQGMGTPHRTGASTRLAKQCPGVMANTAGVGSRAGSKVPSRHVPDMGHGHVTRRSQPGPAYRCGSRAASPAGPAPSPRTLFVCQHITRRRRMTREGGFFLVLLFF